MTLIKYLAYYLYIPRPFAKRTPVPGTSAGYIAAHACGSIGHGGNIARCRTSSSIPNPLPAGALALIKTPRKSRKRYPEGCVEIVESPGRRASGRRRHQALHPAVVYGPSVSSESQRIYYLVRWL